MFVLAISLIGTACTGSANTTAEGDTTSSTTDSPATTVTSVVDVEPAEAEAEPTAETQAPESTSGATIDESGPVSDFVIYLDDADYFDALGADAVRVTRFFNDEAPEVIEFDRFGNFHSDNRWVHEGALVQIDNGEYADVMYGGWLISALTLEPSLDMNALVRDMVQPVGPVSVDGVERYEHHADAEPLLAYEIDVHPEWWEWNDARVEILTNARGAMVGSTYVRDYLWVPAPNMIDPPDPVPTVWTITYEIEAIDAVTAFPDDAVEAADRDDQLVLNLLDMAGSMYDQSIPFNPGLNATLVTQNLETNRSPLLRFEVPIVDGVDDASMDTMGLLGGVFLLQSESGTWFCHAARADGRESRFVEQPDGSYEESVVTASGSDPDTVVRDCQNQRDDLREAQGLSAWNR